MAEETTQDERNVEEPAQEEFTVDVVKVDTESVLLQVKAY